VSISGITGERLVLDFMNQAVSFGVFQADSTGGSASSKFLLDARLQIPFRHSRPIAPPQARARKSDFTA
jgi:hypothetical protein